MRPPFPWQDILDAQQVSAQDLGGYHSDIAGHLNSLPPIDGHALKTAYAEAQKDLRKHMMETVQARAEAMMTPERMAQIAKAVVDSFTNSAALWAEILDYQHRVCFASGPPSRDKFSLAWVDAVQRDYAKAVRFDPSVQMEDQTGVNLSAVRSLPKRVELNVHVEDLFWERIKNSLSPAPLPCRIPDDPALFEVYVEGVKLIYLLAKRSLIDRETRSDDGHQETYSHSFMSAGEIAFGVLHKLDIIRDSERSPPEGRYCSGPSTAIFTQPIEAIDALISQRTEIAPALGHVLCAVASMSRQYGFAYELSLTPARVDPIAEPFVSASVAAGLCARLDGDRALWLSFCDDEILSLYRCINAGEYADDLFTPAQQTARLMRAYMGAELAPLPKDADLQSFKRQFVQPWTERQKQIGWYYSPPVKESNAFWIAVVEALGLVDRQ